MAGPLLAVDAPSLLYRSFFALPDKITDGDGMSVNALLGTTNLMLRVVEEEEPRAVVFCFGPDAAPYRSELYAGYHAERPPVPDKLAPQFAASEKFFGAFGWHTAFSDDLEADDLLGSFAKAQSKAGGRTLLLTGDRDMYQCATSRVTVLYVRTGGNGPDRVDPEEVQKRYGIPPKLVPDFIALRGDPSDGLPGAKGVGEKTAADLLQRHGSLKKAIAGALRETPRVRGALRGQSEELLAFRDIATLREAKVKLPPDTPTDLAGGAKMARSHEMNRLAERLEKAAEAR